MSYALPIKWSINFGWEGGKNFMFRRNVNAIKGKADLIRSPKIRRSSSDTSLPPGGPGKNCERPSSGNSLPIRSKSCLGPFSRAGRNIQESKISHIRSSEVPMKISYDIVSISSSPLHISYLSQAPQAVPV